MQTIRQEAEDYKTNTSYDKQSKEKTNKGKRTLIQTLT